MARAPPAAAENRIYEEVQPQYRWVHGEKDDTLVVDLRGFKNEAEFKKEHLTILIDNYGNLKVSGERPIGGIRWSRFQKVHRLPEDCDATAIRAVFDKGIISVTMPKLVKDKPTAAPAAAPPQKPPSAAQAIVPPKPEPKAPSAVPSAPAAPPPRKPEKSGDKPATAKGDTQQTAPGKAKEQAATAPADSERKAAEPGKKEVEPSSGAETAPSPPVPAEKAAPHVPRPPPLPRMQAAELAGVRRHGKRLVNVVVAIMVLLVLFCYLLYRYRTTQGDQALSDVGLNSLGDSSSAGLSQ